MTGRRWLLLTIAVAAGALLLGKGLAHVYTDYVWYSSLGATDVWRARYGGLLALRAGSAVLASLFVFANLYAVRQSVVSLVLPRRIGNLDIGEEVPRRRLTWAAAAASVVLGVALAWPRDDWAGWVAARSGVPFGEADPYLAADLGFYVYWLPFELGFFAWTLTMVLIVIGLVVLLYALTPSLRWDSGSLYVSAYVRRHLAMLAGILLLTLAWHHRLEMFTALTGGSDGAFGYLDHRVHIPANLLLSLVTLGAGLAVLWAGWTGQMRLAFAAITGVLLATITARAVVPFLVQRATADPTPRERPYVATRAAYSRRAFAVDRMEAADTGLAFGSLAAAAPFVSLWDEAALVPIVRPAAGSALAWTVSDSILVATGVSGTGSVIRVLPALKGTDESPVLGPGDQPAAAVLFSPDSTARPRLVADSGGTIAAPGLRSPLARFAHALAMQDFRIWLGELPDPDPKVITRRAVRERVAALAPPPLFAQSASITPVWSAGVLSWAMELYSTSVTYPLSRRLMSLGADRAYFQHAATALVNGATGRVMLIADSARDPVVATWMRRFPGLFARPAAVPSGIRRQLQPPRESARAQAMAFARFGHRGDAGAAETGRYLPDDEGADSALVASPPPPLGLPDASGVAHVIPVLDRGDRLRGLFIATGGPSQRSFWWPLDGPGPLWTEALDRLQANDSVTATRLVRGRMRAMPVGRQVALLQPRYEWDRHGVPRLLYVGVMERDSARIAGQLADVRRPPGRRLPDGASFRARVEALYSEMRRALARGDWAAYGRAFNELGDLIARFRE